MAFFEKTLSTEEIFQGRVFRVHRDIVELQNGSTSFREVVEHHGGVGILPIDNEGRAVMVRQFRYPYHKELLEIPAGKLEKGEDPYDCAVRELSEETGYIAGKIVDLGRVYPTPGYCSEILHLYLALELTPGKAHLDEDELLNVEHIPLPELQNMIMSGELVDAKTVIAILKAQIVLHGEK